MSRKYLFWSTKFFTRKPHTADLAPGLQKFSFSLFLEIVAYLNLSYSSFVALYWLKCGILAECLNSVSRMLNNEHVLIGHISDIRILPTNENRPVDYLRDRNPQYSFKTAWYLHLMNKFAHWCFPARELAKYTHMCMPLIAIRLESVAVVWL